MGKSKNDGNTRKGIKCVLVVPAEKEDEVVTRLSKLARTFGLTLQLRYDEPVRGSRLFVQRIDHSHEDADTK
jgi:hypothetical protein